MSIQQEIAELSQEVEAFNSIQVEEVEQFRIDYLGKKGKITALFKQFKQVPPEEKKAVGQLINELKTKAQDKVNELKEAAKSAQQNQSVEGLDLTRPVTPQLGSLHPITLTRNRIVDIFTLMGFQPVEGPEVVNDWYNFTALNIPENHPARDMQDTFFIQQNPDIVLRTHTSPVQIQTMENEGVPIKTLSPGRVYRRDNDATHLPVFHQVEGLYVAEGVSFADLKQSLHFFIKEMFGERVRFRMRPSYFPFTEPSAEVDIAFNSKDGQPKWMEVLGCGMVDPEVLKNCGIDPEKYSGFAFGIGIERITMLKYGIEDIRILLENDVRFLSQFSGAWT